MPDPVSGIIGGTALINGYTSKKASDKAAQGADKGLAQSAAMADQSRNAAVNLYNQGRASGQRGLASAFNFYKQSAASRYNPFIQANTAAQGIIGQGAQQANNAILGLPVNMSFAQPQQVNPDMSFIGGAQLPKMAGDFSLNGQSPESQSISNPAKIAVQSVIGSMIR